jgi:type I restriction enzyme, S subunit
MATEWPLVKLGDVADLLTGFPFKSAQYTDDPFAPRLLRGDNVAQGVLRWDGAKRWPAAAVNGLEKYRLREEDVVLAMDRPWIEAGLKFASVRDSDLPSLLVQRVARLRGSRHLDTRFLKFLVGSREFTQFVLAVQTGTAVPHISGEQIQSFRFYLPPLAEQRAIAHILGTLDDKIENNRQMNRTLEEIAAALFTSWFVDFDAVRAKAAGRQPEGMDAETAALFPDRLVESEIGEIPEGWDLRSLDSIARYVNGLALQKYPPTGDESIPVIKIAQLRKGNTDGADRASPQLDPDFIVEHGDILFSWSGTLEVEVWTGGRGALNQHLFKVTSEDFPKWFYFLWTRHHLPRFRELARDKATTMGHIQRRHLAEAETVAPPLETLMALDAIMSPMIDAIISNSTQSRTLMSVRDGLLPKLLSGELRLSS